MNEAQLRNMSVEELLREMVASQTPLIRALVPQIDDLVELHDEIVKHDIDLSLVIKDYQNFEFSLDDFLKTDYWQNWDRDLRTALPYSINPEDKDRAERIEEAAEDGVDGSTHGEVINDWLDCLSDRDADLEFGPLTVKRLTVEAENVSDWHEQNGTFFEQFY